MAGMNVPMNRQASRQMGASAPVRAPRLLMSWEDWLTFIAAFITFVSVAVSIQNADWVRNFPALVPTAICALLIGMVAARVRLPGIIVHPVAIVLGAVVVVLAVQGYADGATLAERLDDFQARMYEWYQVVKANDISNDNLPFVTLVHSVSFLAVYIGSFAIYKWHNPWIALFPAAVVLLANISFLDGHPSGAFVVFLFGAILLVSRLHLQKSQALWKKAGIDYPDFISVSTVQLTVAVAIGLMLVAWLVPLGTQAKVVEGVYNKVTAPFDNENDRLVRLFHNIDSRKGANLHTFGSTLPIEGSVKLGTKQLLEVSASEPGLIRATSYEEYTGAGWKTADRDRERVDGGTLAASPEVAQYEKRNAAPLEVKVLDEAGTVLSAGMPLGSNRDVTIETPEGYRGDIEQIKLRRGLGDGDTYTSIGSQSVATEEELRSAPDEYPDWVKDRYLQLPDDLPQRVHDEATRVIAEAGASNQYDAAAAIEAYLRTFPYDLNVEAAPPNRDIVDFFLFDQKRGYFDWHATAMTVMLRTAGIPARIAVGYALDPADAKDGTYIVRKDDAYSWVEVWFPKYGWIEFNPTP
ncbi:MAG: transglutaminase-like domain-containing protein, partial [Hyphomicrobiales bacterium]